MLYSDASGYAGGLLLAQERMIKTPPVVATDTPQPCRLKNSLYKLYLLAPRACQHAEHCSRYL
ncbi:hypothetical protein MaudCBS49596_003798, partial [Microsporum audouinii]